MPTLEQPESLPPAEQAGAIQSADEMQAGARVVYPKQGVCRILGRESKEIAGQLLEFVALAREEDNATILVPVPKVRSIGLRKVADTTEIADVFDLLASSFDDPELDWKVRSRHHDALLAAGELLGVAEVVKALQGLANLRPLPQKERERYDTARHLLVHEVAVALGVPQATAESYIDFALIPPAGVVRPASRPRRLAPLPQPKPRAMGRRGPAGEEEEEFDLEAERFDEDLGLEPEEEETPAEAEEHEEAEEEEEAPAKKPAARKKAAAPKAAAPAKPRTKAAAAPTKAAAKSASSRAASKKAAEEGAEPEKKAATKAAPSRARSKKATEEGAEAPKPRKKTSRKPPAGTE